jgi:hypothetical protein
MYSLRRMQVPVSLRGIFFCILPCLTGRSVNRVCRQTVAPGTRNNANQNHLLVDYYKCRIGQTILTCLNEPVTRSKDR